MKKGQAAMEFLMTYGWAILVVLAAIGALAYFGVLSPDKFMPSKCMVTGGFSCVEYKITATEVRFYLQNNLGADANITLVGVTNANGDVCTVSGYPIWLNNGERTNSTEFLSVTDCLTGSNSFKGNIEVTYQKSEETETHIATGTISGKMEV